MKQKQDSSTPKHSVKAVDVPVNTEGMRRLKTWLGISIAIFAFLLYARSISFLYTLDDNPVIALNSLTVQGVKAIPELLKTDYWYGFKNDLRVPQYRPSSRVMFAIEWQFFPNNPHVAHLINVLFYALTCWLLFLLLSKLFEGQSLLFPFVCALLYTAHPIHTEVVSSIKSLDEIFCFFFGLLSIYLLVKTIEKKSTPLLIISAVSYFISLASKETAVSFLILMPLTLYVFTKASARKILMSTLLYVLVTIIFFVIWYRVYREVPITINLINSPLSNSMVSAPDFISQKATAFYILLRYVLLLIFPITLSYDYSLAQIPLQKLSDPAALLGILFYFSIGIYAVMKIKDRNKKAFAILFFLLTLAPVSNVFLLIGSTMAERFLYMPSLGFCMMLAFLLVKLSERTPSAKKSNAASLNQFILSNSTVFIITFLLIGAYSVKTIARSGVWKDNVTLYGTDVKVADKSARAHFDWGAALIYEMYPAEKDPDKKNDILEKATKELTQAIAIFSGHPDSYKGLALCYELKKDYADEIKTYETLMEGYKQPDTALFYSLAFAYSKNNEYDQAITMLDSVAKYNSSSIKLYNLRGYCYLNKGMLSESIKEYQKSIALYPGDAETYANMGAAYLDKGENAEAVKLFQKGIKLDPKYAKSYCYMGRSLSSQKQYIPAIEYFNKSLALDSTDEECMKFISVAYINMGDTAKAMSYFQKAKRMKASD